MILLQSDEGLGGLEALTWRAERGMGWKGTLHAAGRGSSSAGAWVMEATKPMASEVSGKSCPFFMLVAHGSLLVPGELLMT